MKANVIVFPGSNCDYDCYYVMKEIFHADVEYVWHKDTSFRPCDMIILPGGFSYGDYLRCGAIARFSPIMNEVKKAAEKGVLVIGICNGFQILLESGLLPGAMLRNKTLSFICQDVYLKATRHDTVFTNAIPQNKPLLVPIAHGEGNYYCDDATLKQLEDEGRIIFQYCSKEGVVSDVYNPNGSRNNIAGIMNKKGTVLGMMPHPERASESILNSVDGRLIFESMITQVTKR